MDYGRQKPWWEVSVGAGAYHSSSIKVLFKQSRPDFFFSIKRLDRQNIFAVPILYYILCGF